MPAALRFRCPTCQARAYWCRYCKVRHCSTCSPHPSRRRKYLAKNVIIRKRNGQCLFMSARRYAHLRGASKGGTVTASRPNKGRWTSETARIAAKRAWEGRWRRSPFKSGLRLGRPRKNRPAVDRAAVRAQYANVIMGAVYYETGIFPHWRRRTATGSVALSERAALRRLGLLPTYTKNWVPSDDEPIVKTTVGRPPATKRNRRK